jgi:hypothetical protein
LLALDLAARFAPDPSIADRYVDGADHDHDDRGRYEQQLQGEHHV